VPTRPAIVLLAALVAAGLPAAAAADHNPLLPPTAADLGGSRSVALGAALGLAGGNEGIFLNAASLAARRRYTIESFWLLERWDGHDAGQFLSLTTVDSQLSSVAGGVSYTRVASGPAIGNVFHVALATRVAGSLFAGVTGKYLALSGSELRPETGQRLPAEIRAGTADASLFLRLGRLLSIGVAGYNLVDVNHPEQAPRGAGAGVGIGDDRRFHLTADWRADFERRVERTDAYAFGGEWLFAGNFPLRAGFLNDDTRDARWWSAGIGYVSTGGFALDLSYRQSTRDASDRLFGVGLKFFLVAS
jgi:opacity protein-like surface antigen